MVIGIRSRLIAVGVSGAAAAPAWGYGGYHDGSGMMFGGGVFGWLVMILVIVLVVAIGIGVVRWLFTGGYRPRPDAPAPHRSALHILEERYARGEIDKDEFEEKRKTLSR
ncbi:MAG TPA: SHOCT domain-containing protein [Gammaproteobacteria bacterium]|nr:SHOCT domain-containing protein [Gammaproteobacteria bacterium]